MNIRTEIDIQTGIEITPEHPELCKGNGETLDENGNLIECCCDECNYLYACIEKDGRD